MLSGSAEFPMKGEIFQVCMLSENTVHLQVYLKENIETKKKGNFWSVELTNKPHGAFNVSVRKDQQVTLWPSWILYKFVFINVLKMTKLNLGIA